MDDLDRFLAAIWQPGDVREVRAPKYGTNGTMAGWFDDPAKLAEAIRPHDGKVLLYLTVNPVDPDKATADNELAMNAHRTTTDDVIKARRFILIDIDPVRATGISSTEGERREAHTVARGLVGVLASEGWPDPLVVMTGNGYGVLYAIDLPNTPESTRLVEGALAALSARFSNARAKVDTTVGNASRIMGVVGTLKVKGDDTTERPHRRSTLVKAPDILAPADVTLLEALCPPRAEEEPSSAPGGSFMAKGWVEDLLKAKGVAYRPGRLNSNGITWYGLKVCPFHDDGQDGRCGVGEAADRRGVGKCFHARGQGMAYKQFSDALGLAEGPGIRFERKPGAPLASKWLKEFSMAPMLWVWPGWIAMEEATLLEGLSGLGKSTFAMDIVARVTTGREMPDGSPGLGEPATVIWITGEDDPDRVLLPRAIAAGADPGKIRFVTGKFAIPGDIAALAALIDDTPGAVLVFIDPLFAHIGKDVSGKTANTISDTDMRSMVMDPLRDLARQKHVALLLSRHLNKATNMDVAMRGSGSYGGITGAARGVLHVSRDPKDEDRDAIVIGPLKTQYDYRPNAMRYEIWGREVYDADGVEYKTAAIEWEGDVGQRIEDYIEDAGKTGGVYATRRDANDKIVNEYLDGGCQSADDLRGECSRNDMGAQALKDTRARLGIVAHHHGHGPWYARRKDRVCDVVRAKADGQRAAEAMRFSGPSGEASVFEEEPPSGVEGGLSAITTSTTSTTSTPDDTRLDPGVEDAEVVREGV